MTLIKYVKSIKNSTFTIRSEQKKITHCPKHKAARLLNFIHSGNVRQMAVEIVKIEKCYKVSIQAYLILSPILPGVRGSVLLFMPRFCCCLIAACDWYKT